jgi:hypothetical protein
MKTDSKRISEILVTCHEHVVIAIGLVFKLVSH